MRSRATRSSTVSRSTMRACSCRASTARTSATGSSKGQRAFATARFHSRRAHESRRHDRCRRRLLPVAPQGRGNGRMAEGAGRASAAVSRGDGVRGAAEASGNVPARGRYRDVRDDRVRHGHRQAGRALRRALGSAEERRRLLPGNGPSRPRRDARECVDGVRPRRRRPAAQDDRRVRCGRRAQARPDVEARRAARAVRDDFVPPRAAAELLRRGEQAVRQLRYVPRAAGVVGRHA